MLTALYLALGGIAASEALLRLPVLAQLDRMARTAASAAHVLRSKRISDHWKERVLPAYSLRLGRASVLFFLLLCLALLPVVLPGLVYPGGMGAWLRALIGLWPILGLIAVSLGYLWLRGAFAGGGREAGAAEAPGAGAYSATDRLLHRLALGQPAIAEMLHDIERARYLRSAPRPAGGAVFVTGLARAGTTALMREIHATGQFGSLTYADMPFVLAPNLWNGLSRRGQAAGQRSERAHGDGIEVDRHSPEALDEVYWRVSDGAAYIRPDGLVPHQPGADLVAGYADLMRLVLRRTGKGRYVSKNNNQILRLPTLAAAFPDARFLVPLRDPLAHAGSLLAQHLRFLDADPFTRDYMTWLGHHEFGATHRPFLFEGRPGGDPLTLDYWLRVWLAAHRALDLAESGAPNIVFVPHEALSGDPRAWPAVARMIGVAGSAPAELRPRPGREPAAHDRALAAEALALHGRLRARGMRRLGLDDAEAMAPLAG